MDATKSVSASSQDTVNNLGMGDKGFYGLSAIGLVIETECRYEAQQTQRRPGGGEHRKAEPGRFDSVDLLPMKLAVNPTIPVHVTIVEANSFHDRERCQHLKIEKVLQAI